MSHLGRRLSALVDGELGDDERDQAFSHLVSCVECRAEVAALRTLKRRMRGLGEATADGALTRRLMALEEQPGDAVGRLSGLAGMASPARGHTRYVVAGAVAALAVGLGAASFAAGGSGHSTGPTVTPRVDSYNVQHAETFGEAPAFQTLGTTRQTANSLRP
jgi:anti-sigma factor RsiW